MENKEIFNVDKYIEKLNEKLKIMHWLIDGSEIHGLSLAYVSFLTKERICELYNVELEYFKN